MPFSTTTSGVPESLQPYIVNLQRRQLILLTSVLNATNNWLTLRYLHTLLPATGTRKSTPSEHHETVNSNAVIFFSILRSWGFWQDCSRKIGRNLLHSQQNGDLVYIDCTNLCTGSSGKSRAVSSQQNFYTAATPDMKGIETLLQHALKYIRQSKPNANIFILLDGLDFLLAAQMADSTGLLDMIHQLREDAFAVIVSASADAPLVQQPPTTPLESEHLAFLSNLAHQASFTIGTRLLSTGAAKDVTGVLRITRGTVPVEEKELLYLAAGDGSVTAFERGAAHASQ